MNVLDVMAARRTTRAFGPQRPQRATVESIIRNAGNAPSMRNTQPWRVRVFSGDPLADLVEDAAAGEGRLAEERPLWPAAGLPAGLDPGMMRRSGLRFYEAPVGLLCTIPRGAGRVEWLDHGGFVYAIAMAACEYGLASCIIADFHGLDELLAGCADLDLAEEEISVGIGLGYAEDERRPLVARMPLAEMATFRWD